MQSDLERLVRHRSISAPGNPREELDKCADTVVQILREAGCDGARIEPVQGGAPAVLVDIPAPEGAPTVLFYAHYDVQPTGDPAKWTSDPFEPVLRDGRLYGRGAADDKSGVVMHAATMRAFGGRPPVGVKILIEGEEESESRIESHVRDHAERFAADVCVIADLGNFRLGEPTITTTLRGMCMCKVTVRTLREPVHSGMFGGPAPDALMALIRLLATLQDENGDVAVDGLRRNEWDGLQYPEADYRKASTLRDDAPLIGTGTLSEMMWARPAISVIGLDTTPISEASNVVIPEAAALIGCRLVPGEVPSEANEKLVAHLRKHAPWGLEVEVEPMQEAAGFQAAGDGPGLTAATEALRQAYGRDVETMGQGGSIPLANVLQELGKDGKGEVILWGCQDEGARIHGFDESLDLEELVKATEAQIVFLELLAQSWSA
jgi:acetylornithine deacetylase/succinyl-diaminopimelate desuccinylase-like protein